MSHNAPALVRQASSARTSHEATQLDIALTDFHRRHGTATCFEVVRMEVSRDGGVEFVVRARSGL